MDPLKIYSELLKYKTKFEGSTCRYVKLYGHSKGGYVEIITLAFILNEIPNILCLGAQWRVICP